MKILTNTQAVWLSGLISALAAGTETPNFYEPPQPRDLDTPTTSFLDHDEPIKDFFEPQWLKDNIPFIDIPDETIQDVYYYRWSSLQRHFRYTVPGAGYITTEFITPVPWSMRLGTINAAAGHHFAESRWLRSTCYSKDYLNFWTRGGGDTHEYTHWIQYAAAHLAYANGDIEFVKDRLDQLLDMWNTWYDSYDKDIGLYYYRPTWDAQEQSLPGFVYAAEYSPGNTTLIHDGPDTYRPTHNSYMAGNAREIAAIAKLAGRDDVAQNFTAISKDIEESIVDHLWNKKTGIFADVIRPNNPNHTPLDGREEVGLVPYKFDVGLSKEYTDSAIASIFYGNTMDTPYGPPTLETNNPYFNGSIHVCCWWNGQSWPFTTSQLLDSLANIYRTKSSKTLTAQRYYDVLLKYAKTQYKDGKPYIAESHDPFRDMWAVDSFNHSEHYAHSTNNDLVLTGLLGVVPSGENLFQLSPIIPSDWSYFAFENLPYHGHLVTVLYDKTGSRYSWKKGLTVFVDGKEVHNGDDLEVKIPIDTKTYPQDEVSYLDQVNIAANPIYHGFPTVEATTDQAEQIFINDGFLYYDDIPNNRWLTNTSDSPNNTISLEFGRRREFSSVTLAFYSDVARGGTVDCPDTIEVYDGTDSLIKRVKDGEGDFLCIPNSKNTIDLGKTINSKIVKLKLWNKPEKTVGVCELEVWVPPSHGPFYYAADALVVNGAVLAAKQSMVGYAAQLQNSSSEINFSGIYSADEGEKDIIIRYSSSKDVPIGLQVNFWGAQNFTLAKTEEGRFDSVTKQVKLYKGLNFINVFGGDKGTVIDTIQVD